MREAEEVLQEVGEGLVIEEAVEVVEVHLEEGVLVVVEAEVEGTTRISQREALVDEALKTLAIGVDQVLWDTGKIPFKYHVSMKCRIYVLLQQAMNRTLGDRA